METPCSFCGLLSLRPLRITAPHQSPVAGDDSCGTAGPCYESRAICL
jgi:hypothetical protein